MHRTSRPGPASLLGGELGPARVGCEFATPGERAADRPLAGRRCPARETDHLVVGRHVGRGGDQVPRVWVTGVVEQLRGGALLDDPPGVHHRNLISKVGNHREVVRDIERGDLVRMAQLANGGQHVRLSADVEAGGRLVEHDHRRPAGKRHCQPDALLLTAGQLVRITTKELRRAGKRDLAHHLGHAGLARRSATPEVVELEDLGELFDDPQRRVQRGRRILRNVGHEPTSCVTQCNIAQCQHRRLADRYFTGGELHALTCVAEHCEANGGLA